MKFSKAEQRLLDRHLTIDTRQTAGWRAAICVGMLACVAALVLYAARVWEAGAACAPLLFVIGLVVIEHGLHKRDVQRMARILQEYDVALRRLIYPEEEEETI